MQLIVRHRPRREVDVSVVLVDWACRESFHLLDDLMEQTVDRDRYEILWLEYYDHTPADLRRRVDEAAQHDQRPPVDTWAILAMPNTVHYHKHLLYNAGIALASGRIIVICDSDAMVDRTFIESILQAFDDDPNIVLHLDEVRNNHPSFYPFSRPAIGQVTGFGCANWVNGQTTGMLDRADPLHSRNYGACMAARRADLLAIGGADMHRDYLGHIAGPYEMTWRLVNAGKRLVWCDSEWLYHVWHPGQAGDQNLAGPHDGLHLSSRALLARETARGEPYDPHPLLQTLLQTLPQTPAVSPSAGDDSAVLAQLVHPQWVEQWQREAVASVPRRYVLRRKAISLMEHRPTDETAHVPAATAKPLFGYRCPKLGRLRLGGHLPGMVWRQLRVKRRAARWSRPSVRGIGCRERLRKLTAMGRFLLRIASFDRYWARQCWLALAYAAQERRCELILYGEDDAVAMLLLLEKYLPVDITAICPLRSGPPKRLHGKPVVTADQLASSTATVVVASFVDATGHLARLAAAGVPRQRVITLR